MPDTIPTPATTTPDPTPAPTPTPTPTAPWFQGAPGVDNDFVGRLTNRGWHTKSAVEVAVEAVRAHQEAERLIGAPAAEIIRLPKDANAPEWNSIHQRLGRPAEAKGYDFSDVKFTDGSELDPNFVEFARGEAFKANMPVGAAKDFVRNLTKYLEGNDTADAAETAAALAVSKDALSKNWGANANANLLIAQNAVRALGLDADTISKLESVVGYEKVMEAFRLIGSKIGEDRFITNEQKGGAQGVMTRDQALARKNDLKNDKAFVDKFLAGDAGSIREMAALDRLLTG